ASSITHGFAPRMRLRIVASSHFRLESRNSLPFFRPMVLVQVSSFAVWSWTDSAAVMGKCIVSDTGADVPLAQVRAQLERELSMIAEVGYEDYFFITWDLLQTCRPHGIEWITRGSAADSLVCYCLGISDVCPIRFGLYFRRFLNKERMALHKLPDIDIDFAHDSRDDVVKLLFEKYGREHCAVVGGFSTFQARSAFAEVAKVLGLAERDVRRFTEHFPWGFGGGWVPDEPAPVAGAGFIELLRARPETCDLPFEE